MRERAVVVGGGVAGLAAALRLTELGIAPLLIEGSSFPSHKVCGEFFSPECLPLLRRWNLVPKHTISCIRLITPNRRICEFELPHLAGSESRFTFDTRLAEKARSAGARLLVQTHVQQIIPKGSNWCLGLENGKTVETDALLLGVGRLAAQFTDRPSPLFPYIGFKAHFEGIELAHALNIYLLPHGYLGLANIEEGVVNVACLLSQGSGVQSAEDLERYLTSAHPNLADLLSNATCLFPQWQTARVPPFGPRAMPPLPGLFPVGDAAGAIPPISGNGLAMGLLSGAMAAECVACDDALGYRQQWKKRFSARFRWASFLQQFLFRPRLARLALPWATASSHLLKILYSTMREKPN